MDKLDDRDLINTWPSFVDIAFCALIIFLVITIYLLSKMPNQIEIVKLSDDTTTLFKTGEAVISDIYKDTLDGAARTIKSNEQWKNDKNCIVIVKGHTDNVPIQGKYSDNWELSTARALSVLRYLVDKGIPENRIRAIGYGDTDPVVKHKIIKAEPKNRRIEIMLLKTDVDL